MTNEVLDIHKYTENGVRYVLMTEDHFNQFVADAISSIATKLTASIDLGQTLARELVEARRPLDNLTNQS